MTPSEMSGSSAAPRSAGTTGTGTDASRLEIRPIRAADRAAFLNAYERLGEQSRYRRFLTPHGPLTDAELRYFTEVDHHDHEAVVAIDPATGAGVGVARYVRSRTDPTTAEVAVAVVDDWQGRGVGTRLATALARRARREGIASFTALMLADNVLILNLIKELGEVRERHTESGIVEVTVDLPERGVGRWVARMLRAVAGGELRFHAHGAAPPDPGPPPEH